MLVTGPAVFISFTMESDGAGAVAKAIPPNRYNGTPVIPKMTPNTRLTTRNVPRDSVMVVTTICLPAFFILRQISSVPIMRPTTHSRMLSAVVYHAASIMGSFRRPSACGPNVIPANSHPRIAGNLSFETSFPNKKATKTAKINFNTSKNTILNSTPKYRRSRLFVASFSISLLDGTVYIFFVNFIRLSKTVGI